MAFKENRGSKFALLSFEDYEEDTKRKTIICLFILIRLNLLHCATFVFLCSEKKKRKSRNTRVGRGNCPPLPRRLA